MKLLLFFLTAVLLVPPVFSFDCSLVNDTRACIAIQDSNLTNTTKDYLLAGLVYPLSSSPDHDLVREYNLNLPVSSPPGGVVPKSKGHIKDAWVRILAIMPSVEDNDTLFVPGSFTARLGHGYDLVVPADYVSTGYPGALGGDCRTTYALTLNQSLLVVSIPSNQVVGDVVTLSLCHDASLLATLSVNSEIQAAHYHWNSYCCVQTSGNCPEYCHSCLYAQTDALRDSLTVQDSLNLTLENSPPMAQISLLSNRSGTVKLSIQAQNASWLKITFPNASYEESRYVYSGVFTNPPYDFLQLQKTARNNSARHNLYATNGTVWIADSANCILNFSSDFSQGTGPCVFRDAIEPDPTMQTYDQVQDWGFLAKLLIAVGAVYLFYMAFRVFGKRLIPLLVLILFIPGVHADCGLADLGSCLPHVFFDFITGIINAPLQPLLSLVKTLLETAAPIGLFEGLWGIVVYILSMFYAFLFMYSGVQFMISGMSSMKRYMAKEWLKNTLLLMIFVQASYYLYSLVIDLGGVMTSTVLQLVNPTYFQLTTDNLSNAGLEVVFGIIYLLVLFLTVLFLTIRFLLVAAGVVFVPIGVFLYFIPPLRGYGKFILNTLSAFIFLPFIDALILLTSSLIAQQPVFASMKILVMITSFILINLLMVLMVFLTLVKSAMHAEHGDVGQAFKHIALMTG